VPSHAPLHARPHAPARVVPAILAAVTGATLLATLFGCSASGPSASDRAASDRAASTGSGSSTRPTTAGSGAVCSLLPLDTANAVVGVVFTIAEDSVDSSTGDRVCTYGSSDGAAVAVLGVVTPGRTTFEQLSARGGSPTPVDQVGDRAVQDGAELDIQKGDRLLYVISTGTSDLGLGNLVAMGSATVARLS
jgi:hypothetical protein